MTERDALLRAVCENPDDDTPRLVFADWLQEHGDEARAEFIRLQVETERIPLSSPAGQASFFRERELLSAHEASWRASLPRPFDPHPFVRGFVETATIDSQRPFGVADLEALFAAGPLVDLSIYLLPDPGMLVSVPEMARLRELTIGVGDPSDESVELFLTKTDLSGLKSITVYGLYGLIWPPRDVSPALARRFRERFKGILVEPLPVRS